MKREILVAPFGDKCVRSMFTRTWEVKFHAITAFYEDFKCSRTMWVNRTVEEIKDVG